MSEATKKKRVRSVILVSAVGAMACGGQAEGDGSGGETDRNRSGDGDGYVDYGPVGQPPDYLGTGGGGFVGGIQTGGTFIGSGGIPVGTCPITDPSCIGIPGEPPPTGGTGGLAVGTGGAPPCPTHDPNCDESVGGTPLGGMGGGFEVDDGEIVGQIIR